MAPGEKGEERAGPEGEITRCDVCLRGWYWGATAELQAGPTLSSTEDPLGEPGQVT